MARACRNIILAVFAVTALVSCSKDIRVIPRDDMAMILHDMFLADAWLARQGDEIRNFSDSTNFYEPVFKAYGYTSSDFMAAVDYYLNDPERFERIVKITKDQLESELNDVSRSIDEKRAMDERSRNLAHYSSRYVLYRDALAKLPFLDRVNIQQDSTGRYYPEAGDEEFTYSGPAIIMKGEIVSEDTPADTLGTEVKEYRQTVDRIERAGLVPVE